MEKEKEKIIKDKYGNQVFSSSDMRGWTVNQKVFYALYRKLTLMVSVGNIGGFQALSEESKGLYGEFNNRLVNEPFKGMMGTIKSLNRKYIGSTLVS
jgi:hypothetical protein